MKNLFLWCVLSVEAEPVTFRRSGRDSRMAMVAEEAGGWCEQVMRQPVKKAAEQFKRIKDKKGGNIGRERRKRAGRKMRLKMFKRL